MKLNRKLLRKMIIENITDIVGIEPHGASESNPDLADDIDKFQNLVGDSGSFKSEEGKMLAKFVKGLLGYATTAGMENLYVETSDETITDMSVFGQGSAETITKNMLYSKLEDLLEAFEDNPVAGSYDVDIKLPDSFSNDDF